MTAPIVLDIDGTLTRADGEPGIDPRVFEPLRTWPEPVVVATGKAFPFRSHSASSSASKSA